MSLPLVDLFQAVQLDHGSPEPGILRGTKSEPIFERPGDHPTSSPEGVVNEIELPGFDPSITSPVFYGYCYYKNIEYYELIEALESNSDLSADIEKIKDNRKAVVNCEPGDDFDPSKIHLACYGYQLLTVAIPKKHSVFEKIQSPKTCTAKEYVETYIFPVLLPAMEKMLQEAKKQEVFEKRRTRFNGCDYLTEYLYRNNPAFTGRSDVILWDIPFVQRILKEHPRPPLPLSLLITEEEAAEMIQSFWRGYQVRKDPEVQELRKYQKEMREEEYDINFRVSEFWKQHPVDGPDEELAEERGGQE